MTNKTERTRNTWHSFPSWVFIAILTVLILAGMALLARSSSAARLGATANPANTGKQAAPGSCGAIGFSPAVAYSTGTGSTGVAAGDLNGDGRPDLAVSNYRGNNISVLLGNGNGTFQPQSSYPAGSLPYSAVMGDFNGDGRLDLATGDGADNVGSVLLGNGDGTLQARTTYGTDTNPIGLVTADFNGDGLLDLASANYGSGGGSAQGSVSVLLGNGNGSFRTEITATTGINSSSLAAGDLNGDGRVDLVVGNAGDGTVSALLGNGDGSFRPQTTYAAGSSPSGVKLGDFNGDGRLDVAVGNTQSNNVSVLLGNGDGTFRPQSAFSVGNRPENVVVADFDGDGRRDIATANNDGTVSVLQGNGDGTFQPQVIFTSSTYADNLVAADFNGDGRTDLAVDNFYDNSVSILLNNCTGGGSTATATTQPTATPSGGTATPTTIPGDYNDVPPGSPFYPFVECLTHKNIISGYTCGGVGEPCPGTYFRPNNDVTRGQASKIISLAAGYNDNIPANRQTFADVPPSSPFWLYVERIAAHGTIGGYQCGGVGEPCPGAYFRPGNNLSRGQLAKIDAGAANYNDPIPSTQQTFADVPPSSTFWVYIERVSMHGVISGYACGGAGEPCPGTYYRPSNNVTRGQTAKIIGNTFFPGCTTLR